MITVEMLKELEKHFKEFGEKYVQTLWKGSYFESVEFEDSILTFTFNTPSGCGCCPCDEYSMDFSYEEFIKASEDFDAYFKEKEAKRKAEKTKRDKEEKERKRKEKKLDKELLEVAELDMYKN